MSIQNNLLKIVSEIPEHVKLVAVSKTKPLEDIEAAYNLGHRIFGENKVQEIVAKQPELPDDIQWHFIGHLQSNKVKFLTPFVDVIHSVDSLKLLKEINKQAKKSNRIINCLLQFHIASEETKFGLDYSEAQHILTSEEYAGFVNIKIGGVMGMATFSDNENIVRNEFKYLKDVFHKLKSLYFSDKEYFKEISMGMSSDYKIAIEEGSTIIRLGSLIFGKR